MQFNILKEQSNFIKDKDPGPFSKNNGFIYSLELDGYYYKGTTGKLYKLDEKYTEFVGIGRNPRQQ